MQCNAVNIPLAVKGLSCNAGMEINVADDERGKS